MNALGGVKISEKKIFERLTCKFTRSKRITFLRKPCRQWQGLCPETTSDRYIRGYESFLVKICFVPAWLADCFTFSF